MTNEILEKPMNGYSLDVEQHSFKNNNSTPYCQDSGHVIVQNGMDTGGGEAPQLAQVPEDLYTQLAERERDLELAAELGKALLEQNGELKKNQERVIEEYNTKVEELNEEKHKLRLQQTALEAEYELTIKELQHDISQLRDEMETERTQSRSGNKSQSQVVDELMQQNDRLTQQLKQSAATEEQLQTQVETLRHQVNTRKTSMHEHVQQLQMLRDEINLLTERKGEIERRLMLVSEERDLLASQLDDAQDRILMVDRHQVEQQYTIRQQTKELSELRDQNESLQLHVDTSMSTVSDVDTSLLAELEMCDQPLSDHGPDRTSAAEQGNMPYFGVGFGGSLCVYSEEEDIECDDELAMATSQYSIEHVYNEDDTPSRQSIEYDALTDELKQEILEVYSELQRLVLELKGKGARGQALETPRQNGLKAGSLLAVLRELRELTEDIVSRQKLQDCEVSEETMGILGQQVASLKKELCASEGQLDRFRTELLQKDEQLEKRNNELTELAKQFTLLQLYMHQEMEQRLIAERDRLQDESAGITVTKDEIIEQARSDRDQAIERGQKFEFELTEVRQDLLSMDTQLINTIKHKLELSQQLEQWQCDMEDLVSVQVTQKLSLEKGRPSSSSSGNASSATPSPTKQKPKVKFSLPWS